jgi:hypothetical protein
MKTRQGFLLAAAAAFGLFSFASCGGGEDNGGVVSVTGIKLSRTTATIVEEKSATLRVTHEPKEAPAPTDIVWSSSNEEIVTVAGGKIIGVKKGTATITAKFGELTAECKVTVNKDLGDKSLNGSSYYAIAIEPKTFKKLNDQNKISADYRVEGDSITCYVHPDGSSLIGEICTGQSFYDYIAQPEGYVLTWYKFRVAPDVDWSSAGHTPLRGYYDFRDIAAHPEEYVFHIALRTDAPGPIGFTLADGVSECGFAIGTSRIAKDEDEEWDPYKEDIPRGDGLWHEIEIPVTDFEMREDFYTRPIEAADGSISLFSILGGNQSGSLIEYDAVFFYKPAVEE